MPYTLGALNLQLGITMRELAREINRKRKETTTEGCMSTG